MTAHTLPSPAPSEATGSRATGWWGMLLFIAAEASLFAALISSYFYLESGSPVWPPEGIAKPELTLASIGTVILLGSSLPLFWAEAGIRRGNVRALKTGAALSFLLGLIFLGIQAYEYSQKEFRPDTNAYGSLYFTITGFHGAHVIAGLTMNAVIQLRAWLGHFSARRHLAVQNVFLYWHFVDAVWIVVFASLYVSPHLL